MTTTDKIRDALTARLLELEGTTANITKVLNPVEARDPKNRPAKGGGNYAILWTLPGRLLSQQNNKIQWQQTFAADLAVPWDDSEEMESKLDAVRMLIASCFAYRLTGIPCQAQELQDITIGYPEKGGQYAVVSVVADYRYIEELPITNQK